MVTLDTIKLKLAEAIKSSGMTQTEIAKKIKVSQQAISQYISGQSIPTLDTFANLCIAIDVDPAEILCTK